MFPFLILPGAVYRKDLIRVLKMAAAVCPQIRSEKLLAIIDPEEHEKVSNDPAYKASLLAKKELCEETIFWMDFNIDGITLFKSSKAPQVYYTFLSYHLSKIIKSFYCAYLQF